MSDEAEAIMAAMADNIRTRIFAEYTIEPKGGPDVSIGSSEPHPNVLVDPVEVKLRADMDLPPVDPTIGVALTDAEAGEEVIVALPDVIPAELATGKLASNAISRVLWVRRNLVVSNDYNPNSVPKNELQLLKTSIMADSFCVEASTPVLCADLAWRGAGSLRQGDRLIALDEDGAGSGTSGARRFRTAEVTFNEIREDDLYRVVTERGEVLTNADHPWLAQRLYGDSAQRTLRWVPTKDLLPDDLLVHLLAPWETDRSYEAGWLAGFLDGEGSMAQNQTTAKGHAVGRRLTGYQRPGPTADRMVAEVTARVRATVGIHERLNPKWHDMTMVRVDRLKDIMRLLGTVRPERLIEAGGEFWDGVSTALQDSRARVFRVEREGRGLIASLTTSTRTYIAGGFAMHNTQPIVTVRDEAHHRWIVVDGFHRHVTAGDIDVIAKWTDGYVPIVVLDKPIAERMASTVRHNRARGKHSVAGMSSLVLQMLDEGLDDAKVCSELGLTIDELTRLKYVCLSDDTEVLTSEGWKRGLDAQVGDEIAAWNPATETITLQRATQVTVVPYRGPMVVFRNHDMDQLVTPNHRVFYRQCRRENHRGHLFRWWDENWSVREAVTIDRSTDKKFPTAGTHSGSGIGGARYAALLGWVWTEGGFDQRGTGVRVYQSRSANPDHCDEIRELLRRLEPSHKTYQRESIYESRRRGAVIVNATTWMVTGALALRVRADLPGKHPSWSLLWRMTLAEKRAFWEAAMKGDGSGDDHFYQDNRPDLEWAQALMACIGQRGKIGRREPPRESSLCLYVGQRASTEMQGRHLRAAPCEDYDGLVWCVTVPTGAFVVRRNGKVFITGNSGFAKLFESVEYRRAWLTRRQIALRKQYIADHPDEVVPEI